MTLVEFLTYMRRSQDSDPLYAFDSKFISRIPILRSEYKIPKFFRQDYFAVLPEEHRPMYRWVVIGPAHSGTGFHLDPNGTSAWNALISGRKRWAFYPPHQTPPGLKAVELDGQNAINDYRAFSPMRWYYEVHSEATFTFLTNFVRSSSTISNLLFIHTILSHFETTFAIFGAITIPFNPIFA